MGFVGLSGPPGGLGQYSVLKPENIHVLPDNIPLDAGAMIEPLGELVCPSLCNHKLKHHGVRTADLSILLQPSLGTPPERPMLKQAMFA